VQAACDERTPHAFSPTGRGACDLSTPVTTSAASIPHANVGASRGPRAVTTLRRHVASALPWALLLTLSSTLLAADTEPQADAASARKTLQQLEAHRETAGVADAINRAQQLLARAQEAGEDVQQQAALNAGALEWAQVGQDWLRALAQEQQAAAIEEEVEALRADLKHRRALLEETEARRGRAEGLVRQLKAGDDTTQSHPASREDRQ